MQVVSPGCPLPPPLILGGHHTSGQCVGLLQGGTLQWRLKSSYLKESAEQWRPRSLDLKEPAEWHYWRQLHNRRQLRAQPHPGNASLSFDKKREIVSQIPESCSPFGAEEAPEPS